MRILVTGTKGQLATALAECARARPDMSLLALGMPSLDLESPPEAEAAILAAKPNHTEATGAVRQIRFLQRATTHAVDAPAVADAAPADVEAAFAAADVEILQQNVEAAFDRLIALIKRTAGDERTAARTRLIELFDLFDAADPEVLAARRKLANALY